MCDNLLLGGKGTQCIAPNPEPGVFVLAGVNGFLVKKYTSMTKL